MYIMGPYDDALKLILKNGKRKQNRTGVDTISIFGLQTRYDISEYFPILTGRKVWPKAIFAELLWILSGSTNNNDLEALGSKIWTPWVDPEFEKKHGYESGELGPVYGFQLRHFGADYKEVQKLKRDIEQLEKKYKKAYEEDMEREPWNTPSWDHTCVPNYIELHDRLGWAKEHCKKIGGFDQLAHMVKTLVDDPNSRRNLFSLWNPVDLSKTRLPPCHYTFQVNVNDGKLSGMLTQRSGDTPIGSPANIQFYSTLIYMLSQQTGLKPHEFVYSLADAHIYVDQITAIEEYLSRPKTDSPKLILKKAPSIFDYTMDCFEVIDYNPLAAIKIPVAV